MQHDHFLGQVIGKLLIKVDTTDWQDKINNKNLNKF